MPSTLRPRPTATSLTGGAPGAHLLALACGALLLGRAYGYFFWGSPLRVALWDEGLTSPLATALWGSWTAYAADLRVDAAIGYADRLGAAVLAAAGLAVLAPRWRRSRTTATLLGASTLLLGAHAVLATKDHFLQLAHLGEYALQVGTPLLPLAYLGGARSAERARPYLLAAISVTFVAHGLYALGVYPVPAHFVDMTVAILGVSESAARDVLFVAGALDLAVAALLWARPTQQVALGYAAAWGLLTAAARVAAPMMTDPSIAGLHECAHATLYRLPHGLVPLFALRYATGADALRSASPSLRRHDTTRAPAARRLRPVRLQRLRGHG